jgi:hypothetical protein
MLNMLERASVYVVSKLSLWLTVGWHSDVCLTDGLSGAAVLNSRGVGELEDIDLWVLFILSQRLPATVLQIYETPIKDRLHPLAEADP